MNLKNLAACFSSYGKISLFTILMICLCPSPAQASIAIDARINITNAIRGQVYIKTITITNSDAKENRIMLTANGDISQWIRFYDNPDAITTLAYVNLPAESTRVVTIKIAIPPYIPNGIYTGVITTSASHNNTDSDSINTIQETQIRVSDEKFINFNAFVTPENSIIKKGDILRIKVLYDNQSNVRIAPSLEIKIRKNQQTVYAVILPYPENRPEIIPYLTYEIPKPEIPTDGFDSGDYEVSMKMSEKDLYTLDKHFNITITDAEEKINYGSVLGIGVNNIPFSNPANSSPTNSALTALITAYILFLGCRLIMSELKARLNIHSLKRTRNQ